MSDCGSLPSRTYVLAALRSLSAWEGQWHSHVGDADCGEGANVALVPGMRRRVHAHHQLVLVDLSAQTVRDAVTGGWDSAQAGGGRNSSAGGGGKGAGLALLAKQRRGAGHKRAAFQRHFVLAQKVYHRHGFKGLHGLREREVARVSPGAQ